MNDAHRDELAALVELVRPEGLKSYLEIGARNGLSVLALATALQEGARIVAVDLPGGPWGDRESKASLETAIARLNRGGFDARAVFGDSTSPEVIAQVRALGPYDLVYLDGDHSYSMVSRDWQSYGELARIVAFDDIFSPFGPSRLWLEVVAEEISRRGPLDVIGCQEIGDPRDKQGIGVLWTGP